MSHPGGDRWPSLVEDGNPDCTAPLAESLPGSGLAAFGARVSGSTPGVHRNRQYALFFS